jgi:signal transduction histidine kinase
MGERGEIFGRRRNGEVFPAEASISRIDIGGTRIFTAVLRDVSDRKAAEAELARLYDAARRATRARDDVLGLVSHDLRNPLSAIAMCIPALRARPAEDTYAMLLDTIQGSLAMANRLIQDLLDVASIEAGKLSMRRRDVTPSAMLRDAGAQFAPEAAERGIALRVACPDDLPPIAADPQRLAQLLDNLIGNALKFTPSGGRITVEGSVDGAELRVTVADTGSGIPPEQLPFIFDRFWHAQREARERSTGLGLTIARGIAEAHGGRIEVESTVGAGSTFTVILPTNHSDPADP